MPNEEDQGLSLVQSDRSKIASIGLVHHRVLQSSQYRPYRSLRHLLQDRHQVQYLCRRLRQGLSEILLDERKLIKRLTTLRGIFGACIQKSLGTAEIDAGFIGHHCVIAVACSTQGAINITVEK
jgi:hypothetical protein